jgi:hypothetical protein
VFPGTSGLGIVRISADSIDDVAEHIWALEVMTFQVAVLPGTEFAGDP